MPISFNKTAFKLAKLLFFMYELVSVIKSEISFIAFGVFIESFNVFNELNFEIYLKKDIIYHIMLHVLLLSLSDT
jgi:hypothetical protein